jgi:hypothetical protein
LWQVPHSVEAWGPKSQIWLYKIPMSSFGMVPCFNGFVWRRVFHVLVVLWFSDGFPMIFRWFSVGKPMVSRLFPYDFLWFSNGFPMISDGFPMVFLVKLPYFPRRSNAATEALWRGQETDSRPRGLGHRGNQWPSAAEELLVLDAMFGLPRWFFGYDLSFKCEHYGDFGDFMGFIWWWCHDCHGMRIWWLMETSRAKIGNVPSGTLA